MAGPLIGIRVLDMSRIMAGPWCTQILADLGAEVIKIERPGVGDDTRYWGPPWLKDEAGEDTREAAYYLSANRGKHSVTVDISQPEGRALIGELAAQADVFIENFKTGGLKKKGARLRCVVGHQPSAHLLLHYRFWANRPDGERRRL